MIQNSMQQQNQISNNDQKAIQLLFRRVYTEIFNYSAANQAPEELQKSVQNIQMHCNDLQKIPDISLEMKQNIVYFHQVFTLFLKFVQMQQSVFGTSALSLDQIANWVVETAVMLIKTEDILNLQIQQQMLIHFIKKEYQTILNHQSCVSSLLRDSIYQYIQTNQFYATTQAQNQNDPLFLVAKFIQNQITLPTFQSMSKNLHVHQLFNFYLLSKNKQQLITFMNQKLCLPLQFAHLVMKMLKIVPDNQIQSVDILFQSFDNTMNMNPLEKMVQQINSIVFKYMLRSHIQPLRISESCYKLRDLKADDVIIYFLFMFQNQNPQQQQYIKQIQADILRQNIDTLIENKSKVHFYIELAEKIDHSLQQQIIHRVNDKYKDTDLNFVVEFLQLADDKLLLERLLRDIVSRQLQNQCGQLNLNDIDTFCVDLDMDTNDDVRSDRILLKDLKRVQSQFRENIIDQALVREIAQNCPYQNVTKGLICDMEYFAQKGNKLNQSKSSLNRSKVVEKMEPKADDAEELIYQLQKAKSHWRGDQFAPAGAEAENVVELAQYMLLGKM
ncbi:Conserved_hypothetical protein [Hexamita inflata]|uniref:Uncharacterized protein n=1 Tax=Hexamita inflata TaxID=28002 RepID=A0AA86NTW4_9EUKA|nr:Conserved hypothetical protein [Hexamita inflata]